MQVDIDCMIPDSGVSRVCRLPGVGDANRWGAGGGTSERGEGFDGYPGRGRAVLHRGSPLALLFAEHPGERGCGNVWGPAMGIQRCPDREPLGKCGQAGQGRFRTPGEVPVDQFGLAGVLRIRHWVKI
jgi:hypothetical protein